MVRKVDTLPDLGDITGMFDAEMRPLLRREVTDAPDPKRIADMDAQYRERLDAMPSDGIEPDDWSVELYGKYEGPIPSEYRQADYERNSPTKWTMSQQDLDRLDARDEQVKRNADAAWNDFHSDYPQYSAEQVEVATLATLDELRDLGISPKKAFSDWPELKERISHTLKFGSAYGYVPEAMEARDLALNDDGRSMGLDYGGGGPRQTPATDTRPSKGNDSAGEMRQELNEIAIKLGLY
jgi:hypothetical protein